VQEHGMPFSDSLPIYYRRNHNKPKQIANWTSPPLGSTSDSKQLDFHDECYNHWERNCSEKRAKSYIHHDAGTGQPQSLFSLLFCILVFLIKQKLIFKICHIEVAPV
jgi:hypothetical protein